MKIGTDCRFMFVVIGADFSTVAFVCIMCPCYFVFVVGVGGRRPACVRMLVRCCCALLMCVGYGLLCSWCLLIVVGRRALCVCVVAQHGH